MSCWLLLQLASFHFSWFARSIPQLKAPANASTFMVCPLGTHPIQDRPETLQQVKLRSIRHTTGDKKKKKKVAVCAGHFRDTVIILPVADLQLTSLLLPKRRWTLLALLSTPAACLQRALQP